MQLKTIPYYLMSYKIVCIVLVFAFLKIVVQYKVMDNM
jgi:hypothetical protein